jgi:hypothetical protein
VKQDDCEVKLYRASAFIVARDTGQCGGLNVSFGGVYTRAKAQKADFAAFLERAETCVHFAGEEPYDDARRAEIRAALTASRCAALEADARALREKHRGEPIVVRKIAQVMEPLGGLPDAPAATTPSHCSQSEELVFSCQTAGNDKVLSICAAPSLGATSPRIVYRFGRMGRVELEYPKKKISPASAFWFSPESNGGTLRFASGKTAYELVADATSATLFVYLKDGSKPMPIGCRSPVAGGLPIALQRVIPRPVP